MTSTASNSTTSATPTASASGTGDPPRRFIYNDADMQHFLAGAAKRELLKATAAMGRACTATTGGGAVKEDASSFFEYDPSHPLRGLSPALASLHGSLRGMRDEWLSPDGGCAPLQDRSQMRFGNPAFRHWHKRLVRQSPAVIRSVLRCHLREQNQEGKDPHREYPEEILQEAAEEGRLAATTTAAADGASPSCPDDDAAVVEELCAYLNSAFGHPVRLDYGTGHECSFHVVLFALLKLGCYGSTPQHPPTVRRLKAATLSLYHAYLGVTRQLQTEYMLEPAGSHGVWGLDDYHCLPFYFGACQLQAHQDEFPPSIIHRDSVLQHDGDKYLYLGCIRYIKALKKNAPFFETSPMLHDISQLPTWEKVSSGLLRLFDGEVLSKRQVVQHFVFGRLFAADWTPSESDPTPPTESFRSSAVPGGGAVGPMARAPWATSGTAANAAAASLLGPPARGFGGPTVVATTRAPRATGNDAAAPAGNDDNDDDDDDDQDGDAYGNPLAPTRAPWAR